MTTVTIRSGTMRYRTMGPDDSLLPPVVFVHGVLVDSSLWDPVAGLLARAGIRSFLVDWPLGSHVTAMSPDADLSPAGVARIVNDVLAELDLTDVTLVGNDTGGAVCQLLLASGARRVGRVALTNCDAFENFPPKAFAPLFAAAKHPLLTKLLLAPMRLKMLRHSPMAYGLLLRRPRDGALTRRWATPAMTDSSIRQDLAKVARGVDRTQLVTAAPRLREFAGPVRIVWATADRSFTLESARRLAASFSDCELVEVPDASTFVSIDAPEPVAAAIIELTAIPGA